MYCIAKNSDKDFTVFYTFASWCGPCIANLPDAVNFSETNNANMYVLLIDGEWGRSDVANAVAILKKKNITQPAVILSDSLYPTAKLRNKKPAKFVLVDFGIQNRKKYANFVKLITPQRFKPENGMSKYIIFNKEGEVVFVSNSDDCINEKGEYDYSLLLNKMSSALKTIP
ncbi:MAG: hypothetical protein LBS01_08280 [Prevotellaceae bacterium]|nr:hypothetical protein [Prevotellaceae bacterium]